MEGAQSWWDFPENLERLDRELMKQAKEAIAAEKSGLISKQYFDNLTHIQDIVVRHTKTEDLENYKERDNSFLSCEIEKMKINMEPEEVPKFQSEIVDYIRFEITNRKNGIIRISNIMENRNEKEEQDTATEEDMDKRETKVAQIKGSNRNDCHSNGNKLNKKAKKKSTNTRREM